MLIVGGKCGLLVPCCVPFPGKWLYGGAFDEKVPSNCCCPQGVRDGGGVLEMCFPGLMIKECQQFESGWGQISSQHPAPLVLPVSPAKLDLEKFMKLILAFSTTSPSVLFLAWAHSL